MTKAGNVTPSSASASAAAAAAHQHETAAQTPAARVASAASPCLTYNANAQPGARPPIVIVRPANWRKAFVDNSRERPTNDEVREGAFQPAGGLVRIGTKGQSDQSGQGGGNRPPVQLAVIRGSAATRGKGAGLASLNDLATQFRRRCGKPLSGPVDETELMDAGISLVLAAAAAPTDAGDSSRALSGRTLEFVRSELSRQGLSLPDEPAALAASMAASSRARSAESPKRHDGREDEKTDSTDSADSALLDYLCLFAANRTSRALRTSAPQVSADRFRVLFSASAPTGTAYGS